MGRPADAALVADEPLAFAPVVLDQTTLTAQATAGRPELAAAEARIAAARDNVRLQRADYRPDLSVGLLQNTTLGSRDF
jgi:outer membrane protein TolC